MTRFIVQVQYWYFELLEQLRKLLMTSVIVFFFPGSLGQMAGAIFITFMGLILSFRLKPCMQPQLNELQAACLSVQGVTLFCKFLIRHTYSPCRQKKNLKIKKLVL